MLKIVILGHNINFLLVKTWFLNKSHEKMDAGMHLSIRKKLPNCLINHLILMLGLPASGFRN